LGNLEFSTLNAALIFCFPIQKLKYKDEDQDMVLLTDQEDLDLVLSFPDAAGGKMELWCF